MPSRTEDPSFAAARNDTLPFPCPDVGDRPEIQLALVEAVHAHSGNVVTVTALVPPAASSIAGGATVTWHFTGDGPADTLEDVSHPPVTTAATRERTTATKRRALARTRSVTGSTIATAERLRSKHHSTVCPRLSHDETAEVGLV